MLGELITRLGHDVQKAWDGPTAIDRAGSYRPDVVLLDLGLPGMSGIDVALALRKRPGAAGIRIVALTGWGRDEDRRQTREAAFDYHLTKPADPEILEQMLREIAEQAGV